MINIDFVIGLRCTYSKNLIDLIVADFLVSKQKTDEMRSV